MKIAYIGYGEAAYNITKGWQAEGLENIHAFDVNKNHPVKGELIARRAKEVGVVLEDTMDAAYTDAHFIFNNTSASFCVDIAKNILPNLKPGQVYLDLNATSPKTKEEINAIPREEGVYFCDIAIMGSVPEKGHKVKMYVSGAKEGVDSFCEVFGKYGMNLNPLDAPAGGASAIKMFKSVFSKGLPQLLFESMVPAAKYGVLDEYVANIKNTFKEKNVEQFADKTMYRTLIHAERRSHELAEVVSTIEALGLDASMSKAIMERLQQIVDSGIPSEIPADSNAGYARAVELMLEKFDQ